MRYNIKFILDYLTTRGWKIKSNGNLFVSLEPSESLDLPDGFFLDLPNSSELSGFDSYIERFIIDYINIFSEIRYDELDILFSQDNSIIKYRIFDSENADGTININKYIDSIESFKSVLYNAVNFTVNKKPIYGQTNREAHEYLKTCKVLQSEKGSYITKFEIPNQPLLTTFNEVTSNNINTKLFDVLDFVKEDIVENPNREKFTENYLSDNSQFINYELLKSIKNVYSKGNISNVEYILNTRAYNRSIVTEKMNSKLSYFDNYLKTLKLFLEKVVIFEAKVDILDKVST